VRICLTVYARYRAQTLAHRALVAGVDQPYATFDGTADAAILVAVAIDPVFFRNGDAARDQDHRERSALDMVAGGER
jgi:hypothetical protein